MEGRTEREAEIEKKERGTRGFALLAFHFVLVAIRLGVLRLGGVIRVKNQTQNLIVWRSSSKNKTKRQSLILLWNPQTRKI